MQCAYCRSRNTVKNGINMIGKQKYKCNSCGRQFVLSPAKFPIPDQTKSLITLGRPPVLMGWTPPPETASMCQSVG